MIMMRLGLFILFVFVLAIGLWACIGQKSDKFENLNSSQFNNLIHEHRDIQIVDVRTAAEFSQGHIQGSKNIDIYDPDFSSLVDKELDTNRPVALYCRSGRRSRNAANILVEKGFKVYHLDKGITGWEKDEMPVVK